MSTIELNVEPRQTGKSVSVKLRAKKLTPAVIYGKGQENLTFCFEEKFGEKMKKQRHEDVTFELKSEDAALNGKNAKNKEVTLPPLTRIPTHIDFVYA